VLVHLRHYTNILLSSPRQVLNASHNAIKFIDNTMFRDAGNLQSLDLSNNQLSRIQSDTFRNLRRLISLKLTNNSIDRISYDAFEKLNLSHLDLSCNKLSKENFLDWPTTVNVRYLNLTFNDFPEINLSLLEDMSVDLWGELLEK
jgi:Leucine-rich repeat (LRR) protein